MTLWVMVYLIWILSLGAGATAGWLGYRYGRRWQARRATHQLQDALSVTHAIFMAFDEIPASLISRDLRRGLVLVVSHKLSVLKSLAPNHPHLAELQAHLARINRIPSGMAAKPSRSKKARKRSTLALERLAELLSVELRSGSIHQKEGDLARASALYTAQQLAVESARQAARDAEHMRAYPQAMNFALQAQTLCRALPPLLSKSLGEAVSADIEHIESLLKKQRPSLTSQVG